MRIFATAVPGIVLIGVILALPCCKSTQKSQNWEASLGVIPDSPCDPAKLYKEININVDLIAPNAFGRKGKRPMTPRYITIHSTQNYTGDAYAHAKALKKGALRGGVIGYLCWHFTVQDDVVIQHIPTSERGEHADFDGPGNRHSIGIEMCEHQGNNMLQTIDRTARLTASLMHFHNIPIENVVPHYHWPRAGYEPPNKNCPHFLLEEGRPKDTWKWFITRVNRHYQRLHKFKQLRTGDAPAELPAEPPVTPRSMAARGARESIDTKNLNLGLNFGSFPAHWNTCGT